MTAPWPSITRATKNRILYLSQDPVILAAVPSRSLTPQALTLSGCASDAPPCTRHGRGRLPGLWCCQWSDAPRSAPQHDSCLN